ncbi:hypothetical protein A7M79_00040 [Acinetobacter baumannii]|uniref:hypothetical protein n=1 Tax=Acinetobacter baumannii TaxID=470 RepID=UPI0008DD747F|nr:hypothetical protein [Acinetobacter baumannii]OIH11912.1 hypothetical protein A7M79_00040 [Acinetobacter baumannii]
MNKVLKTPLFLIALAISSASLAKTPDASVVNKLDKAFLNCKINFDKTGSKSKFYSCTERHDILAADALTDLLGTRATEPEWLKISENAVIQIGFCKDAIASSENKTAIIDEAICGHQYYKSLIISALEYTKKPKK